MDENEKDRRFDAAAMRLAARLVEHLLKACKTPDMAMLVVDEMTKRLRALGAKTEAEAEWDIIEKQVAADLEAGRLERACQACDAPMPPDGPPCPACGCNGSVVIRELRN